MNGPSQQLLKVLSRNRREDVVQKAIDVIRKEFEIYSFVSDRVPSQFTDEQWKNMLFMKAPAQRVDYWHFLALNERRAENDKQKRERRKEVVRQSRDDERQKFESGLMGYGSAMYQLYYNRFGDENLEDPGVHRLAAVERLKDVPKVALDLQFLRTEEQKQFNKMKEQVRDLHSYQRIQSKYPLPFELINFDQRIARTKTFVDSFGYMNRNIPAAFLPAVAAHNPYKGRRNVVYISRHARHVLDGPLKHDTYIVPVSFDNHKVCFSAALRDNIRPVALPIQKYIKWSGPITYPLVNVFKTLEIVARTGGDWELAIRSSYSRRYMMSQEERDDFKKNNTHVGVAYDRQVERQQIMEMIEQGVKERVTL
ncbi:unnamed protein product [Bursaphelenchus okinawaensis]|uniref:SAM-dependent MTase TRM10-type domain-containing protein n=1 Tax=Bursaphelenchus okinawaensis TaxID=465554 RepID=A0A811LNQ2_9BILA|nr:unnamed protein product [Bursaphelenchus okinawaensis]CAG9125676.1 unnamed protein product [Bursaphelenchus okinawaensis]